MPMAVGNSSNINYPSPGDADSVWQTTAFYKLGAYLEGQ